MKDTFTFLQGQPCIITTPDYTDQRITVNGRVWRFDFDRYSGPLWLKKDGEPRACQYPSKAVWAEFNKWMERKGLKKKDNQPMKPRNFVRLFQPRFASLVESGRKKQTIRSTPKRMPAIGDHISLRTWTGKPYRSKQRILCESQITQVSTVAIDTDGYTLKKGTFTSQAFRYHFARKDGFTDWDDMITWFQQTHKLPFTGILIQWK